MYQVEFGQELLPMPQNPPPDIERDNPRRTFNRLMDYLTAMNILPSEHIAFLRELYDCYERAMEHIQTMERYGNEMEAWASREVPKPKYPLRPKPPKLHPYGEQALEYNAPYTRQQPKIRYEYVCEECGEQRVYYMIPSPFKPKYCVREDGKESECQRAVRLRKLKAYNATRSKKKKNL
jgi:hypothetical protein